MKIMDETNDEEVKRQMKRSRNKFLTFAWVARIIIFCGIALFIVMTILGIFPPSSLDSDLGVLVFLFLAVVGLGAAVVGFIIFQYLKSNHYI